MPGKIKVKVLAGRNLPVMDRASDTTDAFVEIKFGSVTHKTDVCRKSLNPHWNNTEWYRFEVDESELQDEPLQLRLMDHDTYSANDAIGKVVISLAPLLAREANNAKSTTAPHGGAVMSGWIPVFDTMHGIRGELNVIVKVELFSDFNKYKTSSCGVQFFHCPMIPPGYRATAIHGFVEELVVNDDPEYQWIDKIRTPRASNEARQVAFIKLSNQVQRLVGLKAAELGANAVVGYQQDFDLEGEAGVVARAVGTAVNIVPLPTPSQPLNMPPCTQQQLKKYLDILVNDNESIIDVNQYYQTHQEELQKLITILNPNASSLLDETDAVEEDEKSMDMTRHSSISSYAGCMSLYQDDYISQKSLRHLSEDQTDLNKLLNKDAEDSDSSGPLQKIKKLKSHFFSKKIPRRRKSEKQEDQISLRSNSSDNSRISLYDIKNEFKKLKKLRKPKFRKTFVNKEDEGEGMVSILARSVIHAHTSLACIAETQDSENSPSSTMRRTSESEPTMNMPEEANTRKESESKNETVKVPEIRYTSLSNINTEESEQPTRTRKISESCPTTPVAVRSDNLLKLPGEVGYYGSVSSELSRDSSEIYSSSDEDDESSDVRTDTEKSIETTSSVVQSVMRHEVDPNVVAMMDRKLCILESVTPDIYEMKQQDLDQKFDLERKSLINTINIQPVNKSIEKRKGQLEPIIIDNKVPIEKCKSLESVPLETEYKTLKEKPVKSNEASTSSVKDDMSVSKSYSHNIKFNNPFVHKKASKSISAPSSPVEKGSFVHRSSKRIKRHLSKLSKSKMIKSLSHYSLLPKKKDTSTLLSQPSSSSDIHSKVPSETVLGSHFLSYSDLLTLDREGFDSNKAFHKSDELHRPKVSMYIGSEPVSRASLSGPSSTYHLKLDHDDHRKSSLKPTGLVHTAMETILLDKVQNLLIPTSPDFNAAKTKQFFSDVNEKLERVEESRSNKNNIEMNAVTSNKARSLSPKTSSSPSSEKSVDVKSEKDTRHNDKPPSLVQTAMETMLIDKLQSMLMPTTPDSPRPEMVCKDVADEPQNKNKNKKPRLLQSILGPKTRSDPTTPTEKFTFPFTKSDKKKEMKPTGLVHTAMETMLMEKVQSVLGPKTPEPVASAVFFDDDFEEIKNAQEIKKEEQRIGGLTQTAVETILMDKVQTSLLGKTPEPIIISESSNVLNKEAPKTPTKKEDPTALCAANSVIFDKVQSFVDTTNIPLITAKDNIEKYDDLKSVGLVQTAVQTMLLDKVQSLIPTETVITIPEIANEQKDEKPQDTSELKSSGLLGSAIQSILLDKVQSLVPTETVIAPESIDKQERPNVDVQELDSSGLVGTAVQTILLDKVQTLIPTDSVITLSDKGDVSETTAKQNLSETDVQEPKSSRLVGTAVQTILLDKVQSLVPAEAIIFPHKTVNEQENTEEDLKASGLIQTAAQTKILDKSQSLFRPETAIIAPENLKQVTEKQIDQKPEGIEPSGLIQTSIGTQLLDNVQNLIPDKPTQTEKLNKQSKNPKEKTRIKTESNETKCEIKSKIYKKLTRQDSIHSLSDNESKTSNIHVTPCNVTSTPVLQHFHPILSGAPLETIPSLPESSIDHTESIDSDTNNASVCNMHAVCDADRAEREKENKSEKDKGSPRHARHESYGGREPAQPAHAQNSSLNASSTPLGIHRRSSDSDLSVTPKGGSLNTSAVNVGSGGGAILRPSMNSNNLDMLEYPFLTMSEYPPGFIVHIGGTVCARSVKLVDGGGESAARAAWWAELRTELRAHARALRCNAVIAYTDTATICEDVCVLSASGTAAVINLDCDFSADPDVTVSVNTGSKNAMDELEPESCAMTHVPYSPGSGPYRAELSTCGGCRRARVPTVLLATCAKPNRLPSYAKAITLTAVAARVRRAPPTSEPGARDISDQLPFLEYELHKLLLAKLRMQGANALFSLQTQIAVGERCVMALASGTAVRLAALPPPTPPRIKASENDKDALEIQKALWDSFTANTIANGYNDIGTSEHSTNGILPEVEGEDAPALDLCADKDACVLELDEAEDVETARTLASRHVNMQVFTPTLKPAIGAAPHAFAQVWRARLPLGGACVGGERHVRRALAGAAYKMRRLQPCALVAPRFQLELPEDEIQLVVSGAAIPLQDPTKPQSNGTSDVPASNEVDDDIFTLDEEQLVRSHHNEAPEEKTCGTGQAPTTVSLTSLNHISGGKLVRRLCALRLLFVRETTAVRELGGLSGFLHTFTCEVMAIVRAYTAALGGNALTSFYITQLMLQDNAHKNQGQCLLSVGGDVVHITY